MMPGQSRHVGKSEDSMHIITLEVTHVLSGWFADDNEPVADHAMSVRVLPGCDGRLSNLSDEGTSLQGEHFAAKVQMVSRGAGQSCDNLMHTWRIRRDIEGAP